MDHHRKFPLRRALILPGIGGTGLMIGGAWFVGSVMSAKKKKS